MADSEISRTLPAIIHGNLLSTNVRIFMQPLQIRSRI